MTGEKTQGQIITLLKTLNERLKVTQADRDRMMEELEKYKGTIEDLEDKANRNEKLALDLEHKIETQSQQKSPENEAKIAEAERLAKATIKELEETRRTLAEMERNQTAQNEALSNKVTKSVTNYNAMRKRLEATEAKQGLIDERVEEALSQQSKLMRKVDKAIEDRARFMRKIERIEETVLQTRDSLNAKAMVLLTEQGAAAEDTETTKDLAEQIPDDFDAQIEEAVREAARIADIATPQVDRNANIDPYGQLPSQHADWWKNPAVYGAAAGITAFMLAGMVIIGLAMNDWQIPRLGRATTDIPVQSYRQSSWQEPVREELPQVREARPVEDLSWRIEPQETTPPTPENVANVKEQPTTRPAINDDIGAVDLNNEEQVAALIESNPQKVAEALNAIEPQKQTPADVKIEETAAEVKKTSPVKVVVEEKLAEQAKAQQAMTTKTVDPAAAKKPNATQAKVIASEIDADGSLPNVIKAVEDQAFDGIGEAQHDLAAIYTAGHGGVKQDYQRASYWFEKAAENGVANAAYNLGVLHHQGLGFSPDINKAMYWYKDAANKGHPEAQYNLGIAYIEGIGVPYDPVTAANFFQGAANNGVMEAAYNLGLIYENGLLGDAEPDKALMWYKVAADQGSPEARQALEELARALEIDLKDVKRIAESMHATERVKNAIQSDEAVNEKAAIADAVNSNEALGKYSKKLADQAVIAQIQEFLMNEGLYPGPADGIDGALTKDAIRSYQTQNGLKPTGVASQSLLGHMLATANKSAIYQNAGDYSSVNQ
jgi:TPR repeat protein